MTDDRRAGDENLKKPRFRSGDRVFRQGDGWYYSLREGDRGPFQTEKIARDELERFIEQQQDIVRLTIPRRTGPDGKLSDLAIDVSSGRKKRSKSDPNDIWKGLPDVD